MRTSFREWIVRKIGLIFRKKEEQIQNFDAKAAIQNVSTLINGHKADFVDYIREKVHGYIAAQSFKTCLTLVLRSSSGDVHSRHEPTPTLEYLSILTAFVRKKPHNGHAVDSGLSEPLAEIVGQAVAAKLEGISQEIADTIVSSLLNSESVRHALAKALVEANEAAIPELARDKVKKLVLQKVATLLGQGIDHAQTAALKTAVAKITATAAASPLAAHVAAALLKTMVATLKPIVGKLLASTAFKTAIVAKIKTVIAASVIGAVIHLVAAKLGIAGGGAVIGFIVLPLLAAYIYYEASHFPGKLAKKVSEQVSQEMDRTHAELSNSLAEKIVEQAAISGVGAAAKSLAGEEKVLQLIREAVRIFRK